MKQIPLSEEMRPNCLEDVIGQDHLLGKNGLIASIVKHGRPLSLLLWGPPGCGKTTLARLYAKSFDAKFLTISAIFSGSADIKKIIQEAKEHPLFQRQLILFVDEIHRFNRAQQDLFLPFMEDGTIVLVGATTENPSFALNDALLSRLRVLSVKHLEDGSLEQILKRYEEKFQVLNLTDGAREILIRSAHGDARHLLNMIENIKHSGTVTEEILLGLLQKKCSLYDKSGEGHYNLISALHKAVRGSDPDASLYWLSRMLQGGEDRQFLARRIIRMASEDIGLADPQALTVALDAWRTFEQLGTPEGDLALAQAVVYLALAPKSNALYVAFQEAMELAEKTSHLAPPQTILNAPTRLMQEMGYGKGYQYDHDMPNAFSGQEYFPEGIDRAQFYHPKAFGFEREMQKRVEYFKKLRAKKNLPL